MNQTSQKTISAYNLFTLLCNVILPLVGTIIFVISKLNYDDDVYDVIGYILFVDLCLGLFLKWANYKFQKNESNFDGTITVKEDELVKSFSLNLNSDPNQLDLKNLVIFKVVKESQTDQDERHIQDYLDDLK